MKLTKSAQQGGNATCSKEVTHNKEAMKLISNAQQSGDAQQGGDEAH